MNPRRIALDALVRIDETDAYANLVLPPMLGGTTLSTRDRGLVTELVYGTTRMRRAVDWAIARFLDRDPRQLDRDVASVLRLGAYQLLFMGTPAHAGVSTAVDVAPARARGLVNAVLRKVAAAPPVWPDPPTRLSYPDWIVERLARDLGVEDALGALEQMNRPPDVHERADGYVQDLASQWVATYVGTQPGERLADLCAAPGGKSTLLAEAGSHVVAGDVHPSRARLVSGNRNRVGLRADQLAVVVADGRRPPLRVGAFDRVLVDAPCSGLGVLARRPDARWHIDATDVDHLADLQRALLDAAVPLLRPGGVLVYAVCTLTTAETLDVDDWLAGEHPELEPLPPPGPPWLPCGRGGRLLPQTAATDGMFVIARRLRE